YGEPHRAYHTLRHLEECFAWFERVRGLARNPGEVALALFFHDAIYDPRAHDNEAKSAALAASVLRRCGASAAEPAVRKLILATKHDAVPDEWDACLLVDIDLSILGAGRDRFDEYESQVRREYAWVAEPDFRSGRRAILQAFLARPFVYATAFFRQQLEAAAR